MTAFILTLLINVIYSLGFLLVGAFFLNKTFKKQGFEFSKLFSLGSSFFIGYALFIALWSTFTVISEDARGSLFLVTTIVLIISSLTILKSNFLSSISRKQLLGLCVLFFTLFSLGTFRALTPMPAYFATNQESVNPFLGFGSVGHSFRAGNISEYITENNTLPAINQHSGQSLLTTIPMFIANQSSQLSITLWLQIFIGFFLVTVYGFTHYFLTKPKYFLIPITLVFLGNTVLSPFYTSITDAESALLLSTNIDSIFGISTFFIILVFLYLLLQQKIGILWFIFISSLLGYIWNITSGQMIVLFCFIILITIINPKTELILKKKLIVSLLSFIIASLIGIFTLGGMLQLKPTELNIPGLMNLQVKDSQTISLRFPRTGEGYSQSLNQFKDIYSAMNTKVQTSEINTSPTPEASTNSLDENIKKNSTILYIAKLVRSVQLVFFPIFGILLSVFLLRKHLVPLNLIRLYRFLIFNTIILFTLGWVASTIFKFNGYYWELSKFLYAGSFLAMLMLGISTALLLQNSIKSHTKKFLAAMILFITIGPTLEYFIIRPLENIYLDSKVEIIIPDYLNIEQTKLQTLTLAERFDLLVDSTGTYGNQNVSTQ